MKNTDFIGIFDSGVGGVSIYKAVKKVLPMENYIYLADKKFFPYGAKDSRTIITRAIKIIDWLISKNTKLVIVACNTTTVESIEYLRKKYPRVLLVGIVPVIKTCAQKTQTGNIGILCTEKTANSKYQKQLIKKFALDKNVYVEACPNLVNIIEEGGAQSIELPAYLEHQIEKLKKNNVDMIALGCSHFPLAKRQIQKMAGKHIKVLDSGHAVARHVKITLRENSLINKVENNKKSGNTFFYTTSQSKKFDKIVSRYLSEKIKSRLINV